jgi:hypothetical protein
MMVAKSTEMCRRLLKQDKAYCMNVHLLVYCISVIKSRIVPVRNNCDVGQYRHDMYNALPLCTLVVIQYKGKQFPADSTGSPLGESLFIRYIQSYFL